MEAATDLILTYRYLFVFALAAFDGPLASFVVGFFVASGHLDFSATYFSLLFGDISTCIFVYSLGHYGSRLHFVQRLLSKAAINGHVAVLRIIWHRHPAKTMFMSKLAYGLSTPFLIAAGVVALPWRKFLVLVSLVAAFQYGVLLTLAASLGNYLGTATDIFWWLKVVVAIVVVVALGYFLVGRRVRDMLLSEEREIDEQSAK